MKLNEYIYFVYVFSGGFKGWLMRLYIKIKVYDFSDFYGP